MKGLLFLIAIFCVLTVNAQNYLISFSGTGAASTITSVKVENLTKGTSLTLNGSDILRLTTVTGVNSIEYKQSSKLKIYPNPMTNNSTMEIFPPVAGNAFITIYDMTGKLVAQIQSYLENYLQEFRISGISGGFYLISVKGSSYQYSGKLLCNGNAVGTIKIEKISNNHVAKEKTVETDYKGVQATVDMAYTTGDRLKFTGISGNYSTVMTDVPASNKTITFNFIACTDGDGNNYPVVKIGIQTWMAENLKTTKLNEETEILNITDSIQWGNMTSSAYCWSRNNISNKDTYGALYNWYTVNTGKLCPTGWHVPTYPEWDTLITFLGGESIAGVSLKETGTAHWNSTSGATNECGFTALGSSYRQSNGKFGSPGTTSGYWWSSSEYSLTYACLRNLISNTNNVGNYAMDEKYGFSVRCLQGEPENELSVEEAFPGVHGILQDFIINRDTITVEKINDKYIFQGDIILTEDQLKSGSNKGAGLNSFIKRWDCCVYYKINNNLMYRKGAILAAMKAWEASTPSLKFIERTTENEKNYVEFTWDNVGCASYLGMVGGRQKIWIADWGKIGNIMHEIGHAIGLIHEHSRIDRDNYVYVLYQNIDPNAVDNFGKINTTYLSNIFDFNSIMLYPSDAFSKNGLPTILKNDGSTFPSNRKFLSIDDIDIVKPMYKNDSVKDIDGNAYRIIKIGNQQWMGANLKTTRYNDGEAIPLVTDDLEWGNIEEVPNAESPAYCWFKNDTGYKDIYGALYNWYAVNTGRLCPTGWHVPTWSDLKTLIFTLDSDAIIDMDYCSQIKSLIGGDKLKETGTEHWSSRWDTCATNEFCFTAIPTPQRRNNWVYPDYIAHWTNSFYGFWWTATPENCQGYGQPGYGAHMFVISDGDAEIQCSVEPSASGLSVRCMKN